MSHLDYREQRWTRSVLKELGDACTSDPETARQLDLSHALLGHALRHLIRECTDDELVLVPDTATVV